MVTQEMKLLISFLQIYSIQWRINSSDHLFKQNQNLLTLSRFVSTFDSKIRRILETLVPTTPVKRVYTHVPGYDTNTSLSGRITQLRLASTHLLSALWLSLCCVYLCTLTFAVKRPWTQSSTAWVQRSNLECISSHKFQLNLSILRPQIKAKAVFIFLMIYLDILGIILAATGLYWPGFSCKLLQESWLRQVSHDLVWIRARTFACYDSPPIPGTSCLPQRKNSVQRREKKKKKKNVEFSEAEATLL